MTTDEILGNAGLKDVTKGFPVSLGGFLFLRLKGLRDVEFSERTPFSSLCGEVRLYSRLVRYSMRGACAESKWTDVFSKQRETRLPNIQNFGGLLSFFLALFFFLLSNCLPCFNVHNVGKFEEKQAR